MLHGLLLGGAVDRGELLVGDLRGVSTHGVEGGDIASQEDLQLAQVDEPRGVAYDRREELLVLLVASQLGLPVVPSRDDDAVQTEAVPEDEHVRVESQLPLGVLHGLRHDHLELQIDLAVALGHVAEGGGDVGGVDHVAGDHLAVVVPDRLHDKQLPSVIVPDLQGVATRLDGHVLGKGRGLLGEAQRCRRLTLAQRPHLARGGAGEDGTEQHRHQGRSPDSFLPYVCQNTHTSDAIMLDGRMNHLLPESVTRPHFGHE